MSFINYIIILCAGTLISWGAWFAVLLSVSPTQAGPIGFFLLYASLTCALTGTFSLIGLIARTVFFHEEVIFQRVSISFRQGLFFSLLIDGILFLQSQRLLLWYNILFLVLGLTIAELFIISRKPARHR